MNQTIQKIIIVGGGTSGWLTACFLQRMLNSENPNQVAITLIEDEDGPIGVGEATIPSLRDLLVWLGIDERRFMIETDATFKMAIRFENWVHDPAIQEGYYYHPFDRPPPIAGVGAGLALLATKKNLSNQAYADLISMQPMLCEQLRTPKLPNSPAYDAPIKYAYHLDAIKFGQYLRHIALNRGVQRTIDQVVEIVKDEREYITSVKTASGQEFQGDFFVDCTGFKGLLINQSYRTPYLPWNKHLFCDRAVALQVPTPPKSPIRPYTRSIAVKHGWIWEIALRTRKGIGYVYSSQFIDQDDAEKELRAFVGEAADNLSARHIPMRIGRHSAFWVKNCLAIGLSAGFLEPLESTGIYLTEMGLKHFLENYPNRGCNEILSNHYNREMGRLYDETLNFVVFHYCLTQREDTEFWHANKYHANLPEELKQDMELWRRRLPTPWDKSRPGQFFTVENYLYILAGMRNGPLPASPHDALIPAAQVEERIMQLAKIKKQAFSQFADHGQFIRALRG